MTDILPSAPAKNKKRLLLVFSLTASFMIVEAVTGMVTKSLALLADAGHMLTDVGGLGLALLAARFAERDATPEKTYGFYRAEILAALANAILLILISCAILVTSWKRFAAPAAIVTQPLLIVAGIGLAVNLIGLKLLHGGHHHSLNVKAAYLEVLSDALASVGVLISGLLVHVTGRVWIDSVMGAAIGLFILPRTWGLLTQAIHILMEGTPKHLDVGTVSASMKEVKGVTAVHDLHIWTITSGVEALSAHVTLMDSGSGDRVLGDLQAALKTKFGIDHVTIQLEVEKCPGESRD